MTSEPNLPRLRAGRVSDISKDIAAWRPLDSKLETLAKDLDSGKDTAARGAVNPSAMIWGHVRSFEAAFRNAEHPGHYEARAAWRALMISLALRTMPNRTDILVEPLQMNPGARGVDGAFFAKANARKPTRRLDMVLSWDPVQHIYFATPSAPVQKRVVIGTLSPTTLVAPSRSFAGSDYVSSPWLKGGYVDPLSISPLPLTPNELQVCAKYVGVQVEIVKGRHSPDDELVTGLINQLNLFRDDLIAAEGGAALGDGPLKAVALMVENAPAGSLYAGLNLAWRGAEIKGVMSDAWLNWFSSKAPGRAIFSDLILADPGLQDALGRSADQISLLNADMLSHLRDLDRIQQVADGKQRQQPEGDEAPKGVLILRPEDIFSDDLTPLQAIDVEAHPERLRDCLLPLKPVALLLGDLEDLKGRLSENEDAEHIRTVSLRVDGHDRHGRPWQREIKRRYYPATMKAPPGAGRIIQYKNETSADPPVETAAWPNFRTSQWVWNYFQSFGPTEGAAYTTTGVSGAIIARDLAEHSTPAERRKRLNEWASPRGPWIAAADRRPSPRGHWFETFDPRIPQHAGGDYTRLQRSDECFEAGLMAVDTAYLKMDGGRATYAGIALLPPAAIKSPASTEAHVAVDFGTTNTMVYATFGQHDPQEMRFKNRMRPFFKRVRSAMDEKMQNAEQVNRGFMPGPEVAQPFATVVQERRMQIGMNSSAELVSFFKQHNYPLLWDSYAFFGESLTDLIDSIYHPELRGTLHFELKPSEDSEKRKLIGRYLDQICILSLAEIVAADTSPDRVKWSFSYPMTQSRDGEQYKGMVRDVLKRVVGEGSEARLRTRNESHASQVYFENDPRLAAESMLVLDVGGGTTDISLFINKPVWRHSVRLAGNELMVDYILRNKNFLNVIGVTDQAKLERKEKDSNFRGGSKDADTDTVFRNASNGVAYFASKELRQVGEARPKSTARDATSAIINSALFRQKFSNEFSNFQGSQQFKTLKGGAYLMLGGLLYYIGMQFRTLATMLTDIDVGRSRHVQLCFSGRGATLFKELGQNQPSVFEDVCKMYGVARGDKAPIALTPAFSDSPKSEASKGMLYIPWDSLKEASEEGFPLKVNRILGASLEFAGGAGADAKSDFLDTEEVLEARKDQKINQIDFSTFHDFIAAMDKHAGIKVEFAPGAEKKVIMEARTTLEAMLKKKDPLENASPPFILLLRAVMTNLYDEAGVTVTVRD